MIPIINLPDPIYSVFVPRAEFHQFAHSYAALDYTEDGKLLMLSIYENDCFDSAFSRARSAVAAKSEIRAHQSEKAPAGR